MSATLLAASRGIRRCLVNRQRIPPTATSDKSSTSDETVLLCLHQWGAHEHPPLTSPDRSEPGTDCSGSSALMTLRRRHLARTPVSVLEEEPHMKSNTGTMEFALRDPDGYCVMVSALFAA